MILCHDKNTMCWTVIIFIVSIEKISLCQSLFNLCNLCYHHVNDVFDYLFQTHYYQPLWTLVGAGLKTLPQTACPMKDVIPKGCDFHNVKVAGFDPDGNTIELQDGKTVSILINKMVIMVRISAYFRCYKWRQNLCV